MASILSGHTGALPVVPSRRIAAGLSVGTNANTEPSVFAHHAPDAGHQRPASDVHAASIKNL